MDVLQRGIIALMRSGLTGETLSLPEGFLLEQAYPVIVRHQIQPLCYMGAVQCGVDKKLPAMKRLFESYAQCLIHSKRQAAAVDRVCKAFDEAEIDYMFLKGWNLKPIYPRPELRIMGDVDILIRTEQYENIRPLMLQLGMEESVESDHEFNWKSGALHLELHKRLIPSYNKDYYRYFGDGWRLAAIRHGTRYEMSREDEFIYLFTHFAKHYRDGGIGCRHAVDLWLFRKAYSLDEQYVAAELDKLRLLEFHQNIRRLLEVWLEERVLDEKTRFITGVIFSSGAWGAAEAHAFSEGVKHAAVSGSVRAGRVRHLLRILFPDALSLQKRYPVLKKYPVLLPVFWPVRWGTALLFRRDNIRKQGRKLSLARTENIESYRQALSYVGLGFHFKEE